MFDYHIVRPLIKNIGGIRRFSPPSPSPTPTPSLSPTFTPSASLTPTPTATTTPTPTPTPTPSGIAFNPSTLFANGEHGGLWVADPNHLKQISNGRSNRLSRRFIWKLQSLDSSLF